MVACHGLEGIHSVDSLRMAFNLKKVLKALLFSSNQPLSIKDIQAAFTRFHEQATLPLADWADAPNPVAAEAEAAPTEAAAALRRGGH